MDLRTVLPGRSPVAGPGHLEDVVCSLYSFHPQTFAEGSARFEIIHKFAESAPIRSALLRRELGVVAKKSLKRIEGRQIKTPNSPRRSEPGGSWDVVQGALKFLKRGVANKPTVGQIVVRFLFALLPLRRPVPGVRPGDCVGEPVDRGTGGLGSFCLTPDLAAEKGGRDGTDHRTRKRSDRSSYNQRRCIHATIMTGQSH